MRETAIDGLCRVIAHHERFKIAIRAGGKRIRCGARKTVGFCHLPAAVLLAFGANGKQASGSNSVSLSRHFLSGSGRSCDLREGPVRSRVRLQLRSEGWTDFSSFGQTTLGTTAMPAPQSPPETPI